MFEKHSIPLKGYNHKTKADRGNACNVLAPKGGATKANIIDLKIKMIASLAKTSRSCVDLVVLIMSGVEHCMLGLCVPNLSINQAAQKLGQSLVIMSVWAQRLAIIERMHAYEDHTLFPMFHNKHTHMHSVDEHVSLHACMHAVWSVG